MKRLGWFVLLAFLTDGAAAQDAARRRVLPDVSSAGANGQVGGTQPLQLLCVQSILDQATGGCLQASSTPEFGMLLPYSGINNTFTGSAFAGGGQNNQALGLCSVIGGGRDNYALGPASTIGGGDDNQASSLGATIAGGSNNFASTLWTAIGGGSVNFATGQGATIGGGVQNTASGDYATVCGGGRVVDYGNMASGSYSAVGGGWMNEASARSAVVSGGRDNLASGTYSAVSGGEDNEARGSHSFAAGRRAMAVHDGSFVWGDSQPGVTAKASSVADEFNVYASGGARFFSSSAATTGVLLAPGGGSWTAVSDRAAKENVAPVDAQAVLEAVVAMPITTWNYREQSDSIRHMGPMAQDFYAAFGLGLGETTIDTIDPDGVALAAIQGLHAQMEGLRAENAELRQRLGQLEELVRTQSAR